MNTPVPQQHQGGKLDTAAQSGFTDEAAAAAFYLTAKKRLLDVNHWAELCKVPLSSFSLTDQQGNPVRRLAETGDYIKIDIPGPGPAAGQGFDWVRIELIEEQDHDQEKVITLRARPAADPSAGTAETAHFFTAAATSSFQVKLKGLTVAAEEHGRNEVPNTSTDSVPDNIRNTLVGWSAKLGLSFPQWKSLVSGIADAKL